MRLLQRAHGRPAAAREPADAFGLILWENVCYLADDGRRRAAFALLKRTVGLDPRAILAAPQRALLAVTSHGIQAAQFADKLRECARIARDDLEDDLDELVRGPVPAAKKALRRFPGIGEPGAEKILLLAAKRPFLAPESNGLRVLVRLGLCPDRGAYAATYRAARAVAAEQLGDDAAVLAAAHRLLRRHGQEVCKRSDPLCGACVLAAGCAYARG